MRHETVRERGWTRHEYDRLVRIGVLREDDPVELIEGRLVVAEPQGDAHARAIELAGDALRAAFRRGWRIRIQLPLAVGDDSEPEPDVAVVRGTPREAPAGHPTGAALIVEVADRSLRSDRGSKGRLYARAGIAEYWIVNLIDHVVEVRREPVTEGRHPRYRALRVARPGEILAPLAAPTARVAVDDLLP